jgi:hypothetical protein
LYGHHNHNKTQNNTYERKEKMKHTKQNSKTMTASEVVRELQATVVEELLDIQTAGFLFVGEISRPECHCQEDKVTLMNDRFICRSCGRYAREQEFDAKGRNKTAVEAGTFLCETGGSELMRTVASKFRAKGGDITQLSKAWHAVGSWLH